MILNTTLQIGIACLIQLEKNAAGSMTASELSLKVNAPTAYTQKILRRLTHAGLLFSTKGIGFRLGRPLSSVTLMDVYHALSQRVDPLQPLSEDTREVELKIKRLLDDLPISKLFSNR